MLPSWKEVAAYCVFAALIAYGMVFVLPQVIVSYALPENYPSAANESSAGASELPSHGIVKGDRLRLNPMQYVIAERFWDASDVAFVKEVANASALATMRAYDSTQFSSQWCGSERPECVPTDKQPIGPLQVLGPFQPIPLPVLIFLDAGGRSTFEKELVAETTVVEAPK